MVSGGLGLVGCPVEQCSKWGSLIFNGFRDSAETHFDLELSLRFSKENSYLYRTDGSSLVLVKSVNT